ncbi:uncharacterized protein AMSG_02845 [Thecamonas trahens ATCC 50062]|uniref:Uncharacterized protein n=1 Tax=Thecamonas trahens ATCC 50062 TaxID=461836 RepID=A0A0L0D280_THETB|nr:hypothetical protein AMSG_02845 [Thecamonas trahens ATCC 50062]KNC46392.1 hypothetical protein AMSG_02845 [Thecamonas trahens ATCC 50062]|eukprot:XP_013760685.1 hypothetical protein AMSG_02845 [Thecamonas trahens ATCC 50062]
MDACTGAVIGNVSMAGVLPDATASNCPSLAWSAQYVGLVGSGATAVRAMVMFQCAGYNPGPTAYVVALDPLAQVVAWHVALETYGFYGYAEPISGGARVVITLAGASALDAQTGAKVWALNQADFAAAGCLPLQAVALDAETVAFSCVSPSVAAAGPASPMASILALAAATGSIRWATPLPLLVQSPPEITIGGLPQPSMLVVSTGVLLPNTTDLTFQILAINTASGQVMARSPPLEAGVTAFSSLAPWSDDATIVMELSPTHFIPTNGNSSCSALLRGYKLSDENLIPVWDSDALMWTGSASEEECSAQAFRPAVAIARWGKSYVLSFVDFAEGELATYSLGLIDGSSHKVLGSASLLSLNRPGAPTTFTRTVGLTPTGIVAVVGSDTASLPWTGFSSK